MRKLFMLSSAGILSGIALISWFYPGFWWAMVIIAPLLLLGVYDMVQHKHTILRNFPIIGHFRYLFEFISPEIQQYFIERHTDGTPFSRNYRRIVYQRAKETNDTHPYGTELNLYDPSYEGLKHSIYPAEIPEAAPRIRIGNEQCSQPYSAALLNISAMSFGAISKNAILALNQGARMGGFYHNTGEGGVSKYHLQGGGDLVWQIGTAYFGCRTQDGRFDPNAFRESAAHEQIKMIELKLSQGAKPGYGGVLPAIKNTSEIAEFRMIDPHTRVVSPPGHKVFNDATGLLRFIQRLRALSNGKPVGFKLCVGRREEFTTLCDTMQATGIYPDFITVDGAEGGTGAAQLEFSDSVGMPLEPALKFVHQSLQDRGLRDHIKLIASGKILTAVSIIKMLALGADICNSARGFMLALGCIQALRCNTNQCPTGITTQNPRLVQGLVVEDKKTRVTNFHKNTVHTALAMMAASGVRRVEDLSPEIFMHGTEWQLSQRI
ncbi:glutamate synthase [Candidatus Tenderia electrophaga]|jgi:glutamate synthase domain-containing protein 2|uniref:Glutamate synthase n=1 Tax=Candidatus Tenderia electrophaga TaxID=1748243 RepID=A0A0S2TCR1_9GAMM|nr:glutamate synthase [Candidatus Tenderia electrophaga]